MFFVIHYGNTCWQSAVPISIPFIVRYATQSANWCLVLPGVDSAWFMCMGDNHKSGYLPFNHHFSNTYDNNGDQLPHNILLGIPLVWIYLSITAIAYIILLVLLSLRDRNVIDDQQSPKCICIFPPQDREGYQFDRNQLIWSTWIR